MSDNDHLHSRSAEHAEAQCNRILDAAEGCFIEHGFHAASMANISGRGQMSAGLIYRYFDNKDAIILAIIERHLQRRRFEISRLHVDFDFVGRVIDLFASWQKGDTDVMNPALFLEMSAEGSRNPRIAEALGEADRLARGDFAAWLKRRVGGDATAQDIERRAFVLQAFIEGLAVRAVHEPGIDRGEVGESIRFFLNNLLGFE